MSILWLKSFHIIAMVTWFAGLFYLPRLFVYHCELNNTDSPHYQRFCTMEYKLYNYITTPGAIITTILGLWLIYSYGYEYFKISKWLHTKILLVLLLWGYHIYLNTLLNKFKNFNNTYSHKFYRIINEIPTVFLISIVLLAVLKP